MTTSGAGRRPVIGITSYVEPASWGVWSNVEATLVPDAYVAHLRTSGALPVVVPPLGLDASEDDAINLLSRLDGLVIAGGADVGSERYGESPHELAQPPREDRDASELLLATAARDRVPTLGICRGMQVMAVAAGGSLIQHLPDEFGTSDHSPGAGIYGARVVETTKGSRLAEILGPRIEVNCYHHQGVKDVPSYDVSAHSDGIVEAIESPGSTFHLGVQWHPEQGGDGRLFDALVAAARRP